MAKQYIIAAQRTAIGKFLGTLASISTVDFTAELLSKIFNQIKVDSNAAEKAIFGNVLSAGLGMGPSRQVAINAGMDVSSTAYGINMICGSGLKAVCNAASDIALGQNEFIVAGGMENMSQAAFVSPANIRVGHKMGDMRLTDTMIKDGLTDAFHNIHMGITAENIAKKYSLSRQSLDEFAALSQNRAEAAQKNGVFDQEITAIDIKNRKETISFHKDEFIRYGVTADKLGQLRPAFDKKGVVTAANSSGINDGAAILFIVSETFVQKSGIKPLAEIIAYDEAGCDPEFMGLGPVPAIGKLLSKQDKITLKDIDLFELNEAFASQSLGVIEGLKEAHGVSDNWLMERTNTNGGAIALGHPIGASGARILVTLIHSLKRNQREYGLASLCIGGGMGIAILIKNCN